MECRVADFRKPGSGFIQGLGFRVQGLGFRVSQELFRFRVQGFTHGHVGFVLSSGFVCPP